MGQNNYCVIPEIRVKVTHASQSGRERELDSKTQTPLTTLLYKPSPKEAERREKFQKLGQAISNLEMAWRDRRGDHMFEFAPTPVGNDPESQLIAKQEFIAALKKKNPNLTADQLAKLELAAEIVHRFSGRTNGGLGNTRRSRGPALRTVQFHKGVRKDPDER